MAAFTKVQWATHTFNGWRGCTRKSEGCRFCYAEAGSKRNPGVLGNWGPNGTRVVASEAQWRQLDRWDREARKARRQDRVFCFSYGDVFEDWQGLMRDSKGRALGTWHGAWPWAPGSDEIIEGNGFRKLTMGDVRKRLARAIRETPSLDYLLVTKRPENAGKMLGEMFGYEFAWPSNWWLGASVENRTEGVPRIEILRSTPAMLRFLSIEPLLEDLGELDLTGISWVIIGGESGSKARACNAAWIRSILAQCRDAGVPAFVKQLGSRPYDSDAAKRFPEASRVITVDEYRENPYAAVAALGITLELMSLEITDAKGGDPSEWPEDLRVREFPRIACGAT